jgi:hypothetical protein
MRGVFTACLSLEVEGVILPQNESIGRGQGMDVIFGHDKGER